MSFFENTRKPVGLGGKLMVNMMNIGHHALAEWGMSFFNPEPDAKILDCGCGGGANIKAMLKKCPRGIVKGVDYSSVSVEKARKLNKDAIKEGRCEILSGSVAKLPLEDGYFDAVTAFETIYFWQDIPQCFREVCRVLKSGGMFMICNECSGDNEKDDKWTEIVDGLTIYRDDEIKKFLEDAGFCKIRINKNERGWLCVTAHI